MKKFVALLVLVGLLVAFAAPSAFAALTNEQQRQLDSIYQQMNDLQKQLVQKSLDAGLITEDQATNMLDSINLGSQYRSQYGYGWGQGRWWGSGMMSGYGFRGMMGGFGGPAGWGCGW
ncbi:MAG: DUF2680 domain-containing protein [Bacillota bacterium]